MTLFSVELHVELQHENVRAIVTSLRDDLMGSYPPVDVGGSYRHGAFEIWLTLSAGNIAEATALGSRAVQGAALRAESDTKDGALAAFVASDDDMDVAWLTLKAVDAKPVLVTAEGVELQFA